MRILRRLPAPVALMAALVTVALLAGCSGKPAPRPGPTPSPSTASTATAVVDPAARAAVLVASLDETDLVGQVLMPYAYGSGATTVSAASAAANRKYAGVDTPAEMISKYRLGGVILMGWTADDPTAGLAQSSNLDSPQQIKELTAGMQDTAGKLPAKVPLLIGTDQEYGFVTRITGGVAQLPSAMGVSAAHDPALTRAAWHQAGADLAGLGITVDFAPDADVLGDSGAGVIGSRSYGSDPAAVSTQVTAAVGGLHDAGEATALKHFPGHGHTTVDSHTSLPVLGQDRAALEAGDLPPFRAGIAAGTDMIMSGHLDVRAIDPGTPASLSSKVLVDLLRGELGFTGVVVTDALNMAPTERYGPSEAAVRALLAGNDLLLMPADLAAAQQGLLDALHTGRLPRDRLVQAATRVLTLKLRLADRQHATRAAADGTAADRLAAAAITVLRGACSGPLLTGPVSVAASSKQGAARRWLEEALRARGVVVQDSGGSVVRLLGYGESAPDTAAVTVAMDAPYALGASRSPTLLATYGATSSSMYALAAVLTGAARAPGRSPVAVGGLPRSACG